MPNKMKGKMMNEDKVSELDPQLWKNLPNELLERVIAKLPFSRVVAFRSVCKLWYSDIIPHAAYHVQGSSRPALLYFGFYRAKSKGPAWWFQICKSESYRTNLLAEFKSRTFPLPEKREDVQLINSQGGLLFFAFMRRRDWIVRDIVVCNPLTSQSRSLGLPCPLGPPGRARNLFLGVSFDSTTGSYHLVAAGLDETGKLLTILYNSSTSTWMNGPSILPVLREAGELVEALYFESRQSVCCNGNLYWYTQSFSGLRARNFVLKFDIDRSTWTLIPDLDLVCSYAVSTCQITSYEGQILLWHLHSSPLYAECTKFFSGDLFELFDPNHVRYPQRIDWPCRHDIELELAPEIKLMHHYMIERIDGFRTLQWKVGMRDGEYFAFSQDNFIYHLLQLWYVDGTEDELKIVVHDTNNNSYTELPTLLQQRVPEYHQFSPMNIWSFSGSLTAMP